MSIVAFLEPSPSLPEPPPSGARLDELYRAHFAMVWRGLRRLGVPEGCLEDAVQDVFLVVHRRLADFAGRSSITTWLYGIVVRVAKDHRRAQSRQAHKLQRVASSLPCPSSAATPVDDAERREANRILHAILAELDDEHREVLVLVELEGVSVREAAAALGLHVRACQRRLRAAREAFEQQLARRLVADGREAP